MGYAVSSSLDPGPRVARIRQTALLIFGALALCLVSLGSITTAGAQSPAGETSQPVKAPDKLVIDADELVYDKDKNTVSAVGSVQLFYQGRILQADRVTYNRATKRVYAEGHAKMTDEHGDVVYGSRFELSDNFREGFIDSVQVLTSDKTRFTSPRVERSNGDVTVLRKGAYTACEPCKDHPERPPFWQVRAARIIENQETHTVYFEDAQMLVWGVPVFYMPYFSSPDATVNKQTGVLAPQFVSGSSLGYGLSLPYFINLAPNYDLTLIPTYLSKQGLLGEVDWRQRLSNGTYSIRMTGIDEQEPNLFASYPYGAGDERVRGSIETKGNFFLNQNWQFGWNATWLSDKFFANDYKLQGIDFSNFYFQDVVSSIYLRGQADHSFFDLSAYHFEGTTPNDDNRTLPVAAPVFDYNRVFAVPADRTYGIGGEATVDINVANIDRTNAAFQSTGLQTFDNAYHLYNVCETVVDGKYVNTYYPGACMLRGIAGDYARASGQVSWQRSYIDTIGEVWKPFVFARLDGEATELNETGSITYASCDRVEHGRELEPGGLLLRARIRAPSPAAWRASASNIAIRSPPRRRGARRRSRRSASSSFDRTRSFRAFSRTRTPRASSSTRRTCSRGTSSPATTGSKAAPGSTTVSSIRPTSPTADMPTSSAASRSRSPGKTPTRSTTSPTPASIPASTRRCPTSSPAKRCSRPRLRFRSSASSSSTVQPSSSTVSTPSPRRPIAGVTASLDYALYAAQPALGWEYPREGLTGNASYKFLDRWSVDGSLVLDMSRHYYDTAGQETPIFYPVGYSFGLGYKDECTTFTVRYSSSLSAPAAYPAYAGGPVIYNPAVRNQTLMFQLVLRTLGDVKANVGL